jgi:hypothetical protein
MSAFRRRQIVRRTPADRVRVALLARSYVSCLALIAALLVGKPGIRLSKIDSGSEGFRVMSNRLSCLELRIAGGDSFNHVLGGRCYFAD